MLSIKTILQPTDFSPQAEYAYHLACALARDYGARLLLQHVKVLPTAVYGEFGAFPVEDGEVEDQLKARMLAMNPAQVQVEHVLCEGVPAEEIVALAKQRSCDLIVMGTHGRTGLGRLLMGSVAELVVRRSLCPVLTVKTPIAEVEKEWMAKPASVPVG